MKSSKIALITRRNKKIFESKINKKSMFLRSLPKKKYEGIKKVEEGKTDLIIDKILGIGEFERDYGFFCPQKNTENTPKNVILNPSLKNSLKQRINIFIQNGNSNNLESYRNYRFDEDNDINYNSFDGIDIKKKYNKSNFWKEKTNNRKNLNQKADSFLSKVGNNIIISNPNLDKDNSKKVINNIENNKDN